MTIIQAIRLLPVFLALTILAGAGDAGATSGKGTDQGTRGISIASVPNAGFDISVEAVCDGKTALIRLVNRGQRWPNLGAFKIHRARDKSLITQRRLAMGQNQTASFRLQGTHHRGDEIGVFIDPVWFDRKFEYDKRITCK